MIAQLAIEREMQARCFAKTTGAANVYVDYYVLATVNQMAQCNMGRFVDAVPEWDLPPFASLTAVLEIYPVGTSIVDITSTARHAIVWRGSAQRKLDSTRPTKRAVGSSRSRSKDLR